MREDASERVLSEPDQFKALGHPLRHRLMVALRQRPATFAQLAAALGATKGTIGYHIKILEQADLVRLAYVRRVRGGTEQYYELTSERLRIAGDAPVGGEFLVRAALNEMLPHDEAAPGTTVLRHLRLTDEQARTLAATIEQFGREITDQKTGSAYGVLVSLYRADIPDLPDPAAP